MFLHVCAFAQVRNQVAKRRSFQVSLGFLVDCHDTSSIQTFGS